MEGYVSEQEQVEAVKKWLRENGPAIAIGLILGLTVIFGWRGWQSHQRGLSEAASDRFAQMMVLVQRNQRDDAQKAALTLISEQPRSSYATFAALMLARLAVDKQDLATAKQQLTWVIDNSRRQELKALARVRLARVHLAEGKVAEAWALVEQAGGAEPTAAIAELRGDVLMAQGKIDEARRQYLDAYARADGAAVETSALALKLDDLGAAPPAAGGEQAAK